MQIKVIAVLIVIAGLIGALLACAAILINRVRAANATLRRIEEALLSLNRVKAIDSAVKSAKPVKQSPPADAGGVGFLTIRELRSMSSRDRQSADGAPIPTGRKPLRTGVTSSSRTDLQGAIGREGMLAGRRATVATHGAVVPALKTGATGQTRAAFADRDARLETSEVAATHEAVPTANDELPIQKAGEAAPVAIRPAIGEMSPEVSTSNSSTLREPEQAPTVESAVGREVPEVGQGGRTAPTGTALDEDLKKKRAQQALMIISSRRRRARAGL